MSSKITIPDILCEFFEVLIHSILHTRKLYPETVFIAKRKYGVVVYQSVQPDINEYINHCLKAVNFHAKNNRLKRLFVCFQVQEKIFEKYVFDVLNVANSVDSDPFLVGLEQSLRNFILKLHSSQNYLDDLPGEATFSIQIETTTYSTLEFNQEPVFEDFPWIEIEDGESSAKSADIVSLHTIKCPFLTLQMFVEKEVTY